MVRVAMTLHEAPIEFRMVIRLLSLLNMKVRVMMLMVTEVL